MAVQLLAVTFDVAEPAIVGAFWAGLLDRRVVDEPGGVLLPGSATQVGLRFRGATAQRREPNRLHLHVTSASIDEQRRTVDTALRLGGRRRGTGPLPFGRDIYLNDPGGDELCLIEPGNRYLAGCGPLGEVTCEGTRAAGCFWRDALGWPTVWDEGDQLAIQSPGGGTKIGWDGHPDPASPGWNRQRFDLVAADPAAEASRLVALGAVRVRSDGASSVLLDPDGSEFRVAPLP